VIPDTLPQVKSDRICYLSIDMNNAAPEIAAAEYFEDRMISGGIIVLDDYGWKADKSKDCF
jgi:O-methyltransferase